MENNKKIVDLLRKAIRVTRGRISEREVFRDFIAFCALQLSVLTDPVHPERAEQLQKIKENYEAEDLTAFSQTFLELAQTIERNIDQGVYEDLLGMAYNECGATNRNLLCFPLKNLVISGVSAYQILKPYVLSLVFSLTG